MFGVPLFPLLHVVRFPGRAPRDVVVFRAKLLPRHNWLIAAAAKPLLKIRFHPLGVVLLTVSTAFSDKALYAVRLSFCCFPPTDYAQP